MLRVGTILHGVYRIDSYLSSGGFGNTYVATNVEFGERFAVKEFFMSGVSQRDANNTTVSVSNAENEATFASQLEKFKKEARRLRKLHSPHIVKVYDLFEENGTAYYVMDYIDGEDLAAQLKAHGPLPEAGVLHILPQLLDALDAAHSAGILHLDLKPANIMVDKQGNALLIDFGASKQLVRKGGATAYSSVSYTDGYAPREQMEQNFSKFGPWTDFYALGATLYTLLTNHKPPLPSDIDDDKTIDRRVALPMPPQTGEATRQLVFWLMATDRSARPQSVAEIRARMSGGKVINTDSDETKLAHKHQPTPTPAPSPRPKAAVHKKWFIPLAIAAGVVGIVMVWPVANEVVKAGFSTVAATVGGGYSTESLQDETFTVGGVSFVMKGVQGGEFTMGATPDVENEAGDDEKPAHHVRVSSFRIGQTEVTQALWKAVMGSNPSDTKGDNLPVDEVSWSNCQVFISKLNSLTGEKFRLPTEAEWEYAARGGNQSRGYKFAGSNNVDDVAWYEDNSGNSTHAVATKAPNELGLYDMSGNVKEWCNDWYGSYSSDDQTNPTGPSEPNERNERVTRGGDWGINAIFHYVSCRVNYTQEDATCAVGFRLAL